MRSREDRRHNAHPIPSDIAAFNVPQAGKVDPGLGSGINRVSHGIPIGPLPPHPGAVVVPPQQTLGSYGPLSPYNRLYPVQEGPIGPTYGPDRPPPDGPPNPYEGLGVSAMDQAKLRLIMALLNGGVSP